MTTRYVPAPRAQARAYPIPAKMPSGRAWEHRLTLYDSLGPGEQRCHWCRTVIHWKLKDAPDAIQVDHLDNDGQNNDLANLVPACRSCNRARAIGMLLWRLKDLGCSPARKAVAMRAGPNKKRFGCGHDVILTNVYTTKHDHRCLTCHRAKARNYWRAKVA